MSLFEILMELRNISFTKLEKETKISNRRLHEIAWEESIPTQEEAEKLAKLLKVDPENLLNMDKNILEHVLRKRKFKNEKRDNAQPSNL